MKVMRRDIKPNQEITTFFVLESMRLRKSRKQSTFLELNLYDRTGKINGYLWHSTAETVSLLEERTFVKVRGVALTSNGSVILNVDRIRAARKDEIDLRDFLEVAPGGIDLWHGRLLTQLDALQDVNCRKLTEAFLSDTGFMELFITSPGGLSLHHNYIGGLVEHTASVMELISMYADRDKALLDRDLLLTGAFLHDIGKTREIYWEVGREFTTEGKLLGHIILGIIMLEEKLAGLKSFPEDLANRLKHMIASHHGALEHGSPVKPSIPEALVLHMVENTDAKINHLYCHLGNSDPEREWSCYDRVLETEVYQKKLRKTFGELSGTPA